MNALIQSRSPVNRMPASKIQERFDLLEEALISMALAREWNVKYAKFARDGSQSLFVHALNTFSVARILGQMVFDYSQEDFILGCIAAFLHDYQKAEESWQRAAIRFMNGEREFANGIFDHDAGTDASKEELLSLLEFTSETMTSLGAEYPIIENLERILNLVVYTHDTQNRAVSTRRRSQVGPSDRLVPLVRLADSIASLSSPADIVKKTQDLDLPMGIEISFEYHEVAVIRGLVTSFLNEALIEVMKERGYVPLIHFGKGVAYIRVGDASTDENLLERLFFFLKTQVKRFMDSEVYKMGMVNAVIGPLPHTKWPALQLVGKKNIPEIIRYLSGMPAMNKGTDYAESKINDLPSDVEKEVKSFVKSTKSEKLEILALMYSDFNLLAYFADFLKRYSDYASESDKQEEYEGRVDGVLRNNDIKITFDGLSGVSNTTPLEDRLRTVQQLWDIGNENLHLNADRREILVNRFISVLKRVLDEFEYLAPPLFTEEARALLLADIRHFPAGLLDDEAVRELARKPHTRYLKGKDTSKRICNFCGAGSAEQAPAALFGDGSQKFSNFIPGGGRIGGTRKAQVCALCHVEGTLRAFFFPSAPVTSFIVIPDLSLSPAAESEWAEGVKSFIRTEKVGMSPSIVWNMTRVYTALARGEAINNAAALTTLMDPTKASVKKLASHLKALVSSPDKIRFDVLHSKPEISYREIAKAYLNGNIAIDPFHLKNYDIPFRDQGTAYMTPGHMLIFFRRALYLDDKESPSTISIRAYLLGLIIARVFHARVIIVNGFTPITDLSMQGVVRAHLPAPAAMALSNQGISGETGIHEAKEALQRLSALTLISMNYAEGLGKDRLLRLATMNRGAILRRVELEDWSKLKQWQKRRLIDLLDALPDVEDYQG